MSKEKNVNTSEKKHKFTVIDKIKNAVSEANTLLKNIELFIEAICLLILAYAGYWTAFNVPLRNEYKYVLMFAAILIGLRGSILLVQRINKR